jgi:hypothetical protein
LKRTMASELRVLLSMLLTWLSCLMDEWELRLVLDEAPELEVLFLLCQLLGQSFHLCVPSCL